MCNVQLWYCRRVCLVVHSYHIHTNSTLVTADLDGSVLLVLKPGGRRASDVLAVPSSTKCSCH